MKERIKGYVDMARSFERVADLVVISVGHLLACWFAGEQWNNASQSATAFAIVAFCLLAEIAGLYVRRPDSDLPTQGRLALGLWCATLPLLILFQFVSLGTHWYAGTVVVWAVLVATSLYGWRLGLRKMARVAWPGGRTRVAILGATRTAEQLRAEMGERPWLRMQVVGVYDDRGPERLSAASAAQRKGTAADLIQACRRGELDTVIVALPAKAQARVRDLVESFADTTATVYLLADLPYLDLLNAQWTAIGGLPLVELAESHNNVLAVGLRRLAGLDWGRVAATPVVEVQEVEAPAHAATEVPRIGPTV